MSRENHWNNSAANESITYQPIGELLTGRGKLDSGDSARILDYQRKHSIRFGEAAIALGLIKQQDVEHALSTQFAYPYIDDTSRLSADLVLAHKPFSAEADEIRNTRAQLIMGWNDTLHPTFCLISAERGEGRSYIAANLAMGLAQLGRKTLLIDADLRNPHQHQIFNLPNHYGLALFLAGHNSHALVHSLEGVENLSVMPAGPTPPNPLELISNRSMDLLLQELKQSYDCIVIDTSALDSHNDAEVMARKAGSAVTVLRHDKSRFTLAKSMVGNLRRGNVYLAGSVLNRF